MPKFDAGKAVEAVEWDFTAYGGGEGTTPEPSRGQIQKFNSTQRALTKRIRPIIRKAESLEKKAKEGTISGEELDAEVDALETEVTEKEMEQYEQEFTEALAELCSGSPSVDDMEELPFRVKQAWAEFVLEQFSPDPEKERPGTKR